MAGGKPLRIVVQAVKDPDAGNLDRIQIVKVWLEDGKAQERIFDVAWAGDRKPDPKGRVPAIGSTVNVEKATYTNDIGATELVASWQDPDFRADQTRRVLRARARNPDAALVHLSGRPEPSTHPDERAGFHPGTRMDVAYLLPPLRILMKTLSTLFTPRHYAARRGLRPSPARAPAPRMHRTRRRPAAPAHCADAADEATGDGDGHRAPPRGKRAGGAHSDRRHRRQVAGTAGQFRLEDLNQRLPSTNVLITNPRQMSFAVRGLGNNPANDALESSVGTYLDNVYLGRPGMANFDLIDIDQIALLRGPQGTLFGKNTTAGVLNISTRAPSFEPSAAFESTGGNDNYWQVRGAVTGPITENLAGRLSASKTYRDGFIDQPLRDNELNEANRTGARGQLLWDASDALNIRFIADYNKEESDCCAGVIKSLGANNGAAVSRTHRRHWRDLRVRPELPHGVDQRLAAHERRARRHVGRGQLETGRFDPDFDLRVSLLELQALQRCRRCVAERHHQCGPAGQRRADQPGDSLGFAQ